MKRKTVTFHPTKEVAYTLSRIPWKRDRTAFINKAIAAYAEACTALVMNMPVGPGFTRCDDPPEPK